MSDRKKVAVVGSNSFSGSDFIDLLLEEGRFSVVGLSRSPEKGEMFLPYKRHKDADFRFYQADLNKDMEEIMDVLDSFKPDYIVNFAAQSEVAPSWETPWQWFQTNAVALTKLVHFLKDRKYLKRYVHISSPEVYGTCEGVVKEDAPLNPTTPYAASKAAGDMSLFTYVKNFEFPMVMIRSTNVYGAHRGFWCWVVGWFGGGGGGGGICEIMGVPFEEATRAVKERLGQDRAYVIDSGKARDELGWKPVVPFDEGLGEVVKWVDSNWGEIVKEPLKYMHKP
jgi:dTDP-glucose 4,6-dehydratase